MAPLRTFRTYTQALPRLIVLQMITKPVLAAILALLNVVADWALAAQGRVAVTTGDFAFLFTTPHGLILMALGVVTLYLYVAFDLTMYVSFSNHWLRGDDVSIRQTMLEGLSAIRRFLTPSGAFVVLYVALIAPIVGSAAPISLTKNFYIPTFITSVITSTPLYNLAYRAFCVFFFVLGIVCAFCVQGMVHDGLTAWQACRRSARLVREHWLDFLLRFLSFSACMFVLSLLVTAVVLTGGASLGFEIGQYVETELGLIDETLLMRTIIIFGYILTRALIALIVSLGEPLTIMRVTELYLGYQAGEPVELPVRRRRLHLALWLGTLLILSAFALVSLVLANSFDEFFPARSYVQVIAHRTCGSEGIENSVSGIDTAVAAGAWGAETDIQRTLDGAYVINHDATFQRVAGVDAKPSEMNVADIRKLTINDERFPSAHEPVPTYEEMLDACNDRILLFVELKGETADRQMADDAVRIARERGMFDQCVFISLDYELIDYLETTYPNALTGFLEFASYGDTASLNCDFLALEEESATADAIDAIHAQGKNALVWTVNDKDSQRRFLCSDADAIITDNVTQAIGLREGLEERSDMERVADRFSYLF